MEMGLGMRDEGVDGDGDGIGAWEWWSMLSEQGRAVSPEKAISAAALPSLLGRSPTRACPSTLVD